MAMVGRKYQIILANIPQPRTFPDQEDHKMPKAMSEKKTLSLKKWQFKTLPAAAKSLQSCPTLCDPIDGSPPGSPHPWDSHAFPFQCMKVKSEREVAQSCPTLSDPMDYSPPGSSIHGIFQARILEWGAIAF